MEMVRKHRSFCYVDELVDGMIKFMDSKDDLTGPLNMGNPEEYSILDIAKTIDQINKFKIETYFQTIT